VFPKAEFLLVGYLTAKWTGAKLFPYFHNTYAETHKGWRRLFASWVQGKVFARANHVFVMSEGMAELYRERYPGLDCSPLVHSFHGPIPEFTPPPEPASPPKFIISGHVWDVCLDATKRICEAISSIKYASLTFLSGTPRESFEQMGLLCDGFKHEMVPHGKVVSRLRQADIVLLPHGFHGSLPSEEYRTIFPTRTIEYLLCGRPILAHTPPNCYLTRFLKTHECALVVDEPSVQALVEAIERLRRDAGLRNRLVKNAIRVVRNYHAPRIAATLRARLHGT
jgi:glycosyltransferase involved in cell wall biosynthesis